MPETYRKLSIDNELSILWMYANRSGSGADFEVKAVKPYTKTSTEKTLYGIAKLTVRSGYREVILHDIIVYPSYRQKSFGSKMLKFIVEFVDNGHTEIIKGDIRGKDDPQIATKFLEKNGFILINSEFSLLLEKSKYGHFTSGEIEAITRKEYTFF